VREKKDVKLPLELPNSPLHGAREADPSYCMDSMLDALCKGTQNNNGGLWVGHYFNAILTAEGTAFSRSFCCNASAGRLLAATVQKALRAARTS
jgi:hypothetical protein